MRRGFTIGELIVALGLLAVIATVVVGLFLRLTVSSTKSEDQTVALEIANRLLDEYAEADPSTWNVSANQDLETHDPSSKTTFYYRLRNRKISDDSNPMGYLFRLDVDVSWWPADPANPHASTMHRRYGKTTLHLSRVVFVEDFH